MSPVVERLKATFMHVVFCNKGGSSFIEMRNTRTNTKLLNEMPHLVFQHRIKGLGGPNWLSKLILIILPNNKEHSLVLLGTRKKSMA